MCQVAINTCICNATLSDIQHAGVWISHVSWDSTNRAFTCRGRSTFYRIIFSQRLTEAGLNTNALILILILICMLLLISLILMRRKLQDCKKRLEQKVESLEDIIRESKEIFVITLEGTQTSSQVLR